MMLTHSALEVNAEGAVEWAATHPGWFIFPGRLTWDDEGRYWKKVPLVRWTAMSSTDPDEIRSMWEAVGGTACVFVACAPSNIWCLDMDNDLPDDDAGREWKDILDAVEISRGTLVLQSSTRSRPHYIWKQGKDWVAEGRWLAGDVKSSGIIVISNLPPLVDAPVAVAPQALLDKLRLGRPKGSHGRGACSKEEMWDWLTTTPDPEDLLLDTVSGDKFLDAIIRQLADKIDAGAHRRMAVLDSVFQAAIEAEAGCYPAEFAYTALKDAYREWREVDTGDKGWTRSREVDFDLMWQSLIPSLKAGDHNDKIAETRSAALDRYGMWLDTDAEIEDLIRSILDAADSFDPDADPDDPDADPDSGPDVPAKTVKTAIDNSDDQFVASYNLPPHTNNTNNTSNISNTSPPPNVDANGEIISPAPVTEVLDPDNWGVPATAAAASKKPLKPGPPEIHEGAFWGPHGDLVEALRGKTESADVGILGGLLAFSGACMAGKAHFKVGVDRHGPNDYFLNIGQSSAARKSTGANLVEHGVFYDEDRMTGVGGMFLPRKVSGIASGEKMIHIWDPIMSDDKVEEWPERRVIMIEQEASVVWKRARRDGAVLSDVFCKTWDQSDLATHAVTSGSITLTADKHLMGFIGCSTMHVAVAAAKAGDGADAKSGFANRFVWLYLPDSFVDLPFGSDLPADAVRRYQDRLGLFDGSLAAIGSVGFGVRADWAPDAREKWASVYGDLKRNKGAAGFIEGMLSRAESHVLRMALNYWLAAGGDPTAVGMGALDAALAVWAYSKASVEFIFGGSTGDKDADNLVAELETRGGWATMEELRAEMNKNSLAGLVKMSVNSGVIVAGNITSGGRPGRPARAIALTEWHRDGRLAPVSSGIGRSRGTPLGAVRWDCD